MRMTTTETQLLGDTLWFAKGESMELVADCAVLVFLFGKQIIRSEDVKDPRITTNQEPK